MKSLYQIYLQQQQQQQQSVNNKTPSIIRLQKYDNDDNDGCCDCECRKDGQNPAKRWSAKFKHESSPKSYIRISQPQLSERPKTTGGLADRFKALPMTKVEFVREEYIKEVAEKRRRKCFKQKNSLLFSTSRRDRDENVLWSKFGLSPVNKHLHSAGDGIVDEELLVLEDLEYQLTSALREEGCFEDFVIDDGARSDVGDVSARTGLTQSFIFLWNHSGFSKADTIDAKILSILYRLFFLIDWSNLLQRQLSVLWSLSALNHVRIKEIPLYASF